ncbi:CgeB family protein [Texcoconibacillus texcoconensis]|uniref:Spore maturation protein CgeB n=1 Tax=Texcoconibacillus texcoconensis TaxID=1095777 RepID=A0A840QUA1_9BACI|nr:DUF3880 domain-containing protein [Texcoconibacillus texcoconensis]MBB5174861.1 spore maturation protein CgeB [Texcoconibacillus texcoconensis]
MNILYVRSTSNPFYQYIDDAMISCFQTFGYQVSAIETLDHLTEREVKQTAFLFTTIYQTVDDVFLKHIRDQGIPLVAWVCEGPYYVDDALKFIHLFDIIFCAEKNCVAVYHELGHQQVYHLPIGFDPHIYHKHSSNDTSTFFSDVCLVGYPYANRISFVQRVLKETSSTVQVVGHYWRDVLDIEKRNPRLKVINYWIPSHKAAAFYRQANIVLNLYHPYEVKDRLRIPSSSPNARTYEVAACSAFQLTDQYFRDDERTFLHPAIQPFKHEEEGISWLKYYIDHSEERTRKARVAFDIVHKNDTFMNRTQQLITKTNAILRTNPLLT